MQPVVIRVLFNMALLVCPFQPVQRRLFFPSFKYFLLVFFLVLLPVGCEERPFRVVHPSSSDSQYLFFFFSPLVLTFFVVRLHS